MHLPHALCPYNGPNVQALHRKGIDAEDRLREYRSPSEQPSISSSSLSPPAPSENRSVRMRQYRRILLTDKTSPKVRAFAQPPPHAVRLPPRDGAIRGFRRSLGAFVRQTFATLVALFSRCRVRYSAPHGVSLRTDNLQILSLVFIRFIGGNPPVLTPCDGVPRIKIHKVVSSKVCKRSRNGSWLDFGFSSRRISICCRSVVSHSGSRHSPRRFDTKASANSQRGPFIAFGRFSGLKTRMLLRRDDHLQSPCNLCKISSCGRPQAAVSL